MDKKSFLFLIVFSIGFLFLNQYLFPPGQVAPDLEKKTEIQAPSLPAKPSETFYVLQNEYQQLVFSSAGGALSEINLALQTKENQTSSVLPISFDRVLAEDYPSVDHFPAYPAKNFQGTLVSQTTGGFYPLLRRGIDSKFYALATQLENGTSGTFSLKSFSEHEISFVGTVGSTKITKTYTLPQESKKAPYCFDLKIELEGSSDSLAIGTGIPEVELISGSSTPSLKYRFQRNQKKIVEQISLPKSSENLEALKTDWICNSNGFLGVVLDPLHPFSTQITAKNIPGNQVPTRISWIDAENELYPLDKYPGYTVSMALPQKSSPSFQFRVYAGPFSKEILSQVDRHYMDPVTKETPGFVSCISFHGWFSFISEPFAKFLFFLMNIFHYVSRSWGLSIILLTVALRLMLYPLNAWTIRSTLKMQQVSPKVAALQEKYKKDPKRAQVEIMGLYRHHGVNPLGGCLPLLIQMPFLIGMFDLLKSSFELRGASFIPGWIDNLSAPDVVFSWGYPIWFFGTSFHLLPILLGVVMFYQQKFSSRSAPSPKQMTDLQRQQKMMGNMMVIIFSVLFYHFPSGLNIYWLSSMLLGILQQWHMGKKVSSLVV